MERALQLAQTFLRQEQFGEAEKLAHHALAVEPDNLEARVVLTKAALATGRLERGQSLVSELLARDPEESDHQALQGMAFMLSGKPKQSIAFLKKALKLGQEQKTPGQLASYANTLVLAYHQINQPKLALRECLDALENYPQEPNLYLTCSRLYREAKDFSKALDVAQRGLDVAPEFYALYASVALARANLGQPDLAEQAYLKLKEQNPELAADLKATLDGIREDKAEIKVRVD